MRQYGIYMYLEHSYMISVMSLASMEHSEVRKSHRYPGLAVASMTIITREITLATCMCLTRRDKNLQEKYAPISKQRAVLNYLHVGSKTQLDLKYHIAGNFLV